MSDITYVGANARNLELAPELDRVTRVIVVCDENTTYTAGNDTGRTLTATIPWGSQQIADDLLSRVSGNQYQPYTATGAQVDPAAELGDAVSIRGAYGGIFSSRTRFGRQLRSDISAPFEEEIDHEFPYKPSKDRAVERQMRSISSRLTVLASEITAEVSERKADSKEIRSTLSVLPGQISAKVSATQEGTFGWNLNSTSWTLNSGSKTVLKATKDGIEVTGKIRATSGSIGGFTINSNYLSYNGQTWGGTNTTGAYIGKSGIQLGKNFKVDMQGNLAAASGTFAGKVNAGNIQYGDSAGYLSGSGLASHSVYGSQIGYNTISTAYTSSGINTSLGYADYANGVFNGWNTVNLLRCSTLSCSSAVLSKLTVGNFEYVYKIKSFVDGNGNNVMIEYLGRKS